MSFEKLIRIPNERIAVLIGKSGKVKSEIERLCHVALDIDGDTGEIMVRSGGDIDLIQPFRAMEIVTAIGRGFSPENALTLLEGDNTLHVMDLREFAGKSSASIERIKGRLIGESGKARRNMESLSKTRISVYGKTASIIGTPDKLKLAINAISSLSSGGMHGTVYNRLEAANRKHRQEKMIIWEDQDVFS